MGDRRYFRPRSPPLVNPGRTSLPTVNYGSSSFNDMHAIPPRRDSNTTPRSNINPSGPTVTTYKIKTDVPGRSSSVRDGRRRSTLDSTARPILVTPTSPRRPGPSGSGLGRPSSPMHNPYRSSDEGDYYAIPASSGRHRTHHRPRYSATMDNADVNALARESGRDRYLRMDGGREGAMYPRSRPIHSGSVVRHPDTMEDDYGEDGFGYTNPRDLVQFDLSQPARYPPSSRRESQDSRSSRPSMSGYHDFMPRTFDPRERGPPPTTRGFDRLPGRSTYDPPSLPVPPPESLSRSSRAEVPFAPDPPRKGSSSAARPVTVVQEPERRLSREEHYDPRDDERRERPRRPDRYNDDVEHRGYPVRTERNARTDYRRDEYEQRNDHDGRTDRRKGRDSVSGGLSVAGAALGLGAVSKMKEDERDEKDESRRRRDIDEEPRKRREPREDRERIDLTGRDPRERRHRDDRDIQEETRNAKERLPRDEKPEPLDLSGRNPKERHMSRDDRDRDEVPEPRNHRKHRDSVTNGTDHDTRSESSAATDDMVEPRYRRSRPPRDGPSVPFDPKNTMDLRALKDALSKQDTPAAPVVLAKEPLSHEAAPGKAEPRETLDRTLREGRHSHDRGRSSSASSRAKSQERRPMPRVVSPPREEPKKPEDIKPKGILRQPRAKFPEDPAPIREGVAPLKDAKKDGIPADARWTKISRKLVNPDALVAGKERFEAREDFVIVLRVLSKEEVQGYATATQYIRAAREKEAEDRDRRRRRRERHERHSRRGHADGEDGLAERDSRRHSTRKEKQHESHDSHSESDTTDSEPLAIEDKDRAAHTEKDTEPEKLKAIEEAPKARRLTFSEVPVNSVPVMPSAPVPAKAVPVPVPVPVSTAPPSALPEARSMSVSIPSTLQENTHTPGTYTGYLRNPPAPPVVSGRRD